MNTYNNLIQKVKEKSNIVDVISSKVELKKKGSSYIGCCPFHDEKSPSFTVSPSKEIYKCFGCGEAGDVINFVQEYDNLSTYEAILSLSETYNINVKDYWKGEHKSDLSEAEKQMIESMKIALELTTKKYQSFLSDEHYEYFEKRGIDKKMIVKFKIGYAPNGRNLKDLQLEDEILERSGLITIKEDQTQYDFFRGRLMFPIADARGKIISFAGRVLTDKKPKYINTKNTELYQKSSSLYGLHLALKSINKENEVFVVEGYTDTIMMHQISIRNTTAKCGTAFTEQHAQILKKHCDRIVFVPDGDILKKSEDETKDKFKTLEKEINIALSKGFEVQLIKLPIDKDPCELGEEMKERVKIRHDAIEFLSEYYLSSANTSVEKAKAFSKIAQLIAKLNATTQQFYIKAIAKEHKLQVRELKKLVNSFSEKAEQKNDNEKKQEESPDLFRIKVRDTFFELSIIKDPDTGVVTEYYEARKRAELEREIGTKAVEEIPRFNGITVIPNHMDFEYIIKENYQSFRTGNKVREFKKINWYNPLPFQKIEFDINSEKEIQKYIGKILDFNKHIFQDFYQIGLDHATVMYRFPRRVIPAMCLVSREKMTGKSTYTNLIREFYGSNTTTASIDHIMNNFNKILQGKIAVVLEEIRDERGKSENKMKDFVTNPTLIIEGKGKDSFEAKNYAKWFINSNYPEDFMKITDNENRYMVFKVPTISKNKLNNKLLDEMRQQFGYWRYFLEHRKITHEDKTRVWFNPSDYETEALKAVKKRSESYTMGSIKDMLRYIFLNATFNREPLLEIKIISDVIAQYMNIFHDQRGQWKARGITNELNRYSIKSVPNSIEHKYPYINLYNRGETLIVEEKTVKGRYYTFKIEDYLTDVELKALLTKEQYIKIKGIKEDKPKIIVPNQQVKTGDPNIDNLPF